MMKITYKEEPDGNGWICFASRGARITGPCGALVSGSPDLRLKHTEFHASLEAALLENEQEIAGLPRS